MIIFTSYIVIGALIFFGFYIEGVKKHWNHLDNFELIAASALLLVFWGPLLIIELLRRVLSR
jgi:hypothetical protein